MIRNTRVYTPQKLVCGESIYLEQQASHHLIKVLRSKPGAHITLFNGDGHDYQSIFTMIESKTAAISINKKILVENESPINITLLQGLSRSDRMDATIQKSVELGVNQIIPVLCERSNFSIKADRRNKKNEHWKKIIISACEQSGRAIIPKLSDIISLNDAVSFANDCEKLILSTGTTQSLTSIKKPNNICVLIGPEGGFSDEELSVAAKNNFKEVGFGRRILRTETAGPAVITAMQTLWGDLK